MTTRKTTPAEERFWRKVKKTDTCWNWTGTLTQGYGTIYVNGAQTRVHRFAYELLVGPIPAGLHIDHLCRNRRCVNPEHLEPVTNRENVLRGVGFAARNARKTHCPRGHEYTPENTRRGPSGRICRTCHSESCRRMRLEERDGELGYRDKADLRRADLLEWLREDPANDNLTVYEILDRSGFYTEGRRYDRCLDDLLALVRAGNVERVGLRSARWRLVA